MSSPSTGSPATKLPRGMPPLPDTSRRVHPVAKYIAGLTSPLCLSDQAHASKMSSAVISYTLYVMFPIAYIFGNIFIVVFSLCAAGLLSLVLYGPNWHQRKDPNVKFASSTDVREYYTQLYAAREMKAATAAVSSKRKVK